MRHALLSDIHANADALRVVLTDAHDLGCDQIVCLGDILGYGPEPIQTLSEVHRCVHVCLAGNHDDAVCGRLDPVDFTPFAVDAVRRHRKEVSSEACAWLRQLPYVYEQPLFACAHGEFSASSDFLYVLDPDDAKPSFETCAKQLLFVGHTHEPGIFVRGSHGVIHRLEPIDFQLEDGKRYLVNVGSVGYPRAGACRSSYCIFDDEQCTVEFRALPFDLDRYRRVMNGRGLDEAPWMATRAKTRTLPSVRKPLARGFARTKVGGRLALLIVPILLGIGAFCLIPHEVPVDEAKAEVSSVLHRESLLLTAHAGKLYYRIQLAPKSSPVQVNMMFFDAQDKLLPQRFAEVVKRSRKAKEVALPAGSVRVLCEIEPVVASAACTLEIFKWSTRKESLAQ